MSKLVIWILAASLAGAGSILPAQAGSSINFGENSAGCGGKVLCSSDGTHGYLKNGSGRAFRASTISKWFQIDVKGKSHLKGQAAEPLRGFGGFAVVNDTGRPITKFALRIQTDAKSCANGALCNALSAQGGTGQFHFNGMLTGRDRHKCTRGNTMRDICIGDPVSAAFASNKALYSWTAKPRGAIPTGAYFLIMFSGWSGDAWAAPPDPPSIIMISKASDGSFGDPDSSAWGAQAFTADGGQVVFSTTASNLPGSSSQYVTIYIYDMPSATLTPIPTTLSIAADQGLHFGTPGQSISADGSVVGYAGGDAGGDYIYDVATQTTKMFDYGLRNAAAATISGNGRYFVYNYQSGNSLTDVLVYDRTTDTITQMLAPDGNPPDNNGCGASGVSANGRLIPLACNSDNIVSGVSGPVVYVWDQVANEFSIAAGSTDLTEGIPLGADNYTVNSPDGRYMLFDSNATDLVPGGTTGTQVFLYDRQTMVTQLVSAANDGTQSNNDEEQRAGGVSADGRFAVFRSMATNLTDNTGECDEGLQKCDQCVGSCQVYRKDLVTGDIQEISVGADGTRGNSGSMYASISPDGSHVLFHSFAENLPGAANGIQEVYLATVQ